MKLVSICNECKSYNKVYTNFYEDFVAKGKCSCGAEIIIVLQNPKYEFLFESAVNALIEGYTIEAATTLSSAYERFFEFCIRVFCRKCNIDQEGLKSTFKEVSHQSERQLGAFLFLYLLVFTQSYKINHKIAEFRNKTVHKGYIPTPEQVYDYGNLIYKEVYNISKELRNWCHKEIHAEIDENIQSRNNTVSSDIPRSLNCSDSNFFSIQQPCPKESFKEAIELYISKRDAMDKSLASIKQMKSELNEV